LDRTFAETLGDPENGHSGWQVVVTDTPEEVAARKESNTGQFLKTRPKR
jgi:excinuclease UvrABC ATPase subunit